MKDPLIVLGAIMALGLVYVLFPIFLDGFARYRKARRIKCPVKHETTSIHLDAEWAAFTSLSGHTKLRVKSCPLKERVASCKEECLGQVQVIWEARS